MRIGVGIIGCGYWGPHFIRIVRESNLSELIRVCDTDKSRVRECKKLFQGIEFTTSLADILSDSSIQAVIISTPVTTHYKLASLCLSSKKHVLCEKPLTLNSAQAKKLIALSRKENVVLMTGHVFKFNAVVRYMKQMIDKKSLGEILYINMLRTGLGPVRNDVNVVYDLATHDISILNFLFNRLPLSVSAIGRSFVSSKFEDIAIINLEFPPKAIATLVVSWMDPIKQRLIRVIGTKKMLLFDDVSTTEKLKIINTGKNYQSLRGDFGSFQLSIKDGDIVIPNIKYPEPLKMEYEHFLSCIRKNLNPEADGKDGLEVVKVLEAVCESIKNDGKKIVLN